MGWREIIHQYLTACIEDSLQLPPPWSRAKFIDEFGTTALYHRENHNQMRLDRRVKSQQVPPLETYKVIEESATRVIAEVEKTNHVELFSNMRYLVVMVDNQWKLDDIFWNCICKNGACNICQGTGNCRLCNGRGFRRRYFGLVKQACQLCEGKPQCTFCRGTGRCDHCLDSPMPGWQSRTNIILDEGDNDRPGQ